MKKIVAFLVALVLLAGTILGIHTKANRELDFDNPDFGYWTDDRKFQSPTAIRANMNEDSLLVLASSELEHGKDTPYHPQNIFKGNSFQPMLVGAGYYQSLSHAITLAAVAPEMKKKKVVLMVSPQWFRKKGVNPKAFASRFSESSFLEMIKNNSISSETKKYITNRTIKLLSADAAMQKRVMDYQRLYIDKELNPVLQTKYKLYQMFLHDKEKQNIVTAALSAGIENNKSCSLKASEPDWTAYSQQAEEDAKNATSSNVFQISDRYYNFKIKPHLEKRRGSSCKSSYSVSPEYDDLKGFLMVCRDLNIEPMLILLPVNGKWYDYTDFKKERRNKFYKNVTELIVGFPNARMTDLSTEEYTDYIMEDTIHIGWKGWVDVDKIIYQFGAKDE